VSLFHLLCPANVISAQGLVMCLQIHRKLDKHTACVNTVAFNEAGDTLISGSDDQMVMLWDWDTGFFKLEFHTGHGGKVFQAPFMPCTDDRTLVTCAADGEVGVSSFLFCTSLIDHILWIIRNILLL
jgi:WD40 repeat protein